MSEAEKQGAPPAGGAVPGDRYARRRLLAYNEDDVRATAAVRRWMRSTSFPAVEDLDGRFGPVPAAYADSRPGPRTT